MSAFSYRSGTLACEEVSLEALAGAHGTPLYVYSTAEIRARYRAFADAFADRPHLICFSMKANSHLAILRLLAREGAGFDVVSGGELATALRAGGEAKKMVFSGVGKTDAELEAALRAGVLMINVESAQELDAVERVAARLGVRAPVALRVNPDVDPKTHPYISTGMKKAKFGIEIGEALAQYARARAMPHVDLVGIDCHIGSQLTETAPFAAALARIREVAGRLLADGVALRYLDFGGGLGIRYHDETPPTPADYAAALGEGLRGLDLTLVLEPGRAIVGNAGVLVTRVVYRKDTATKRFVIVDGAMNDLVRPALYGSYQAIQPVRPRGVSTIVADVVGPVCESGDFLAKDREIEEPAPGDLLAVMSAGAYGYVMASNYNTRPRPAAVLVDGSRHHVIRERETLDDMLRHEHIPPGL
jgi:diaminopimelate decarboxylase